MIDRLARASLDASSSRMPRPFEKVLVANRGEIARRVLRTCKRLGIRTAAVFSEADRGAPHVTDADEAVLVGPPSPKESYLSIDAIVDAIRSTGAEAVHPGYGFLSENPAFARAVAHAGAVFIGAPPAVLEAFGDKMKARRVALAAGTRPVPGTDETVSVATEEATANAHRVAASVGYPLLAKAVAGGGGIGMQVVADPSQLERALKSCSDRGKGAFADARVYLERCIDQPRHIEVQIFCDAYGGAYALGERECSIQRRHQKIIEETPSPAAFFAGEAGEALRQGLFAAALRVVTHAGYVGAGTCEFLADARGELFFLEVNARLQVEHPVTEMVTGLDLVELQLRVAAGEPLRDLSSTERTGHAIEARVYAEDASKGFLPRPGAIDELVWAGGAGEAQTRTLRIESGVRAGCKVTPFYDPMVAKVVAWGETRGAAIAELDRALAETTIAPCTTNLAFLRKVLADPQFVGGRYDTKLAEALAKMV
jgi:acetyl/propionyl-CoA carboxylase alpha subunit